MRFASFFTVRHCTVFFFIIARKFFLFFCFFSITDLFRNEVQSKRLLTSNDSNDVYSIERCWCCNEKENISRKKNCHHSFIIFTHFAVIIFLLNVDSENLQTKDGKEGRVWWEASAEAKSSKTRRMNESTFVSERLWFERTLRTCSMKY